MKLFFGIFLLLFFTACNSIKTSNSLHKEVSIKTELSPLEINTWYQKDLVLDGIPGISLDKWYSKNEKKSKVKDIIVAIIDTQIDINHEDLQGQLWINSKEIPNNNIDDDKNGYIDDVNGWSFTGTTNGGYVVWNKFEYVRILKKWGALFKDKTESQIDSEDLYKFKEYQKALKIYDKENPYYKRWLKSLNYKVALYPTVKDTLKYFFPKENYTYQQLDSLYKKYKINDKTFKQRRDDGDRDLGALINCMMANMEMNQNSFQDVLDQQNELDSIVNKSLNIDYNERLLIGDDPDVLEKGYGNNNVSNNKAGHRPIQNHGTKMAGIVAANRKNNIGIKGILQNVKIMPLNISPIGDENDKDITMAIRYAVDNGAKIINMSFSNQFSTHKEWMEEAFKYAEEHDVLLVRSAGNKSDDTDQTTFYPNDTEPGSTKEFCSNFIVVGSVTKKLDSTFVSDFSNYGKQNVDLFAPGEQIYSTAPNDTYEFDSGTSMSVPMITGTTALIRSYYTNLTAAQVKQIIIDSGTSYSLEVLVPGTKDKKVPFSELSKSGKVVNVYNAMKLAEKVSQNKK